MTTDIETLVVGAGAVGLAIGRALARAGHEVMVLEQHKRIGAETSSRNSEVIHAGLYYTPGSLKARHCVEGNRMMYAFAAENGVEAWRVGKLLVAVDESEVAKLEAIARTAAANGVTDLVRLSVDDAHALEPEVNCVAAYLSPSTGIIDSGGYVQALQGHIEAHGGQVVLEARVAGVNHEPGRGFAVEVESGGGRSTLTSQSLVISAGLDATRVTRLLSFPSGYRAPDTYLAKGHYFTLTGRAPFNRLVYPMPAGGSLGLHFTRDAAGGGKFGPDIEWKGLRGEGPPDYRFEDEGGHRKRKFEAAIRRYWPRLPDNALSPAYTGLRPKLTPVETNPPADFAIHGEETHGLPRLVALLGIESPGLTSSLAIGEHVARMLPRTAALAL